MEMAPPSRYLQVQKLLGQPYLGQRLAIAETKEERMERMNLQCLINDGMAEYRSAEHVDGGKG